MRKRIKLVIPEEFKERQFETVSSNMYTTEEDECTKSMDEVDKNNHFSNASKNLEDPDSNNKQSELLTGYITETEYSQFKSLELLAYLISDFKEFLDRPEQDQITYDDKDEWFEECQEKITHIEDIIKRLPEESRIEFIESGKSLELKSLVEQVRIRRKEYMHEFNAQEPGIFDQSKRSSDGFSTNRSKDKHLSLTKPNNESNKKAKENSSLEANSTLCPGSKRDSSLKQRNRSISYENANKSDIDRFSKLRENNEINIQNSSLRNDSNLNFNHSLPPPHPSKFSQRKYDDRSQASSRKNEDLKMEYDRKNDFLTVGKDSSIQPNINVDKNDMQHPQNSFYQVMSKQSEKIIEYYK